MTDGDHGTDHSHVSGDGEHAPDHVPDSERGHDHGAGSEGGDDHGAGGDDHGADDHDANGDDDQVGDAAHHADDAASVGVAVVTVSSSRRIDDDPAGDAVVEILEGAGHELVMRDLVRDEFDGVQGTVANLANREDIDAVVTTGGTGVTPDDVTPEAVEPLFSKRLQGFGEEFRRRSVDEVGPMGMASRATAGVVGGAVVAVLPGSESAARTGTDLLASVLGHLAGLAGEGEH